MIGIELKQTSGNYRHLALDEVHSTNDTCMEYGRNGDSGNLWVTAQRQIAGKGSRSRSWTSMPGNLFASLLLRSPCEAEHLAELTFVAAVAAKQAVEGCVGQTAKCELKWPNDLMVNGLKCGGILLESQMIKSEVLVVIGIGINCEHFPEETLHPSTSLKAAGCEVKADDLFQKMAETTANCLEIWNRGAGFNIIRKTWLESAFGMGQNATVNIPGRNPVTGIFTAVDEAGYMLLKTKDGIERVSTADIFFNDTANNDH
ncbi:MAG: biotin--[acetyl-CoA-carboxylase] ligase [Pseudomonadota bacterium]